METVPDNKCRQVRRPAARDADRVGGVRMG